MKTRPARSVLVFVVLLMLSGVGSAWGQLTTGSITGVVQDPSGSVVPGASVILTDMAKGFNYNATTDSSGRYLFRALPPSNYSLAVQASGFAKFEQSNIVLEVNQNVNVNVGLQLPTTGQSVQVVDTAGPALQTEDASTGQTINRVFINDLPLIGRQVMNLAFLAPGVSQATGSAYQPGVLNFGNNFVSNGGRNAQADILLDGVSSTNYEQNTGFVQPLYTPGVDAVEEFKIQQTNFSAEFGFTGGTVVNLVTRSGSNQFHGSLFEFWRNDVLNANGFFNNANDSPRQAYRWNDFGGTVGGPIKKDRIFFFYDYEGSRQRTPSSETLAVPDAQERTGNFGILCTSLGGSFSAAGQCSNPTGQIWDPYYNVKQDTSTGQPMRSTFIPFNNLAKYASPGNPLAPWITPNVPGNLIDPSASKMMALLPLPNIGTPGAAGYDIYHNYFGVGTNANTGNQFDARVDARITDNDLLYIRLSHSWGNSLGANLFNSPLDAFTQGPNQNTVYDSSLNFTHTFSAKTLLIASVGYAHSWSHTEGTLANYPNFSPQTNLGFPSYLTTSGFLAVPAVILGGGYPSENGNATYGTQPWDGLLYGSDVYHIIGSVSHIMGSHELKVGGEFRVHRINFTQYGIPAGLFNFDQRGTSHDNYDSGNAMASFLTGVSSGWGAYEIPPSPATQNFQYAGFVQDNWHVNDKLTLNIGLRYDVDMPRTERYNRMTYFDPSAASPLASVSPSVCPMCAGLTGAIQFVGANGNPRSPYDTYYGAIGPRLGLAYRIFKDTTIRTGYGIYYDPAKSGAAGAGSGSMGFLGFSQQTNYNTWNSADNATPNATLSDPFRPGSNNQIQLPTGSGPGTLANLGNGFSGSAPIPQWNVLPQEQSWSFGIQHQIPWNVLVDAEYVGKKGTHLYFGGDNYALDHLPASIASQFIANPSYWNTQVTNPFVPAMMALSQKYPNIVTPYSSPLWNGTVPRYALTLPYPQYPQGVWGAAGLENTDPPIADSIYHAFQLRIEKRFSQGLQFLTTYSVQKSIDDSSIAGNNVWVNGTAGANLAVVQDPNNLRLERSLSQFDISQIVNVSFVYQLPYGKHMRWGASANRLMDTVFGGWQLNGIYRWDTGLPIILGLNGGTSLPTYGAQRPDLTSALHKADGTDITQYFANPQVAVIPPPYVDGTAPRVLPNIRAPGTNNVSASLFKDFPLWREGTKLQFRAESFNQFNRVQFAAPDATVGDTNFGRITSQANTPRILQLALKMYF